MAVEVHPVSGIYCKQKTNRHSVLLCGQKNYEKYRDHEMRWDRVQRSIRFFLVIGRRWCRWIDFRDEPRNYSQRSCVWRVHSEYKPAYPRGVLNRDDDVLIAICLIHALNCKNNRVRDKILSAATVLFSSPSDSHYLSLPLSHFLSPSSFRYTE